MNLFLGNPVGWVRVNESTKIAIYRKMPNAFHRFMATLLLGWKYEFLKEDIHEDNT